MEGVELDGRFYLGFTALIMLKGKKKKKGKEFNTLWLQNICTYCILICSKEETAVDLMSLLISSELII